jgi:hypothetical protein
LQRLKNHGVNIGSELAFLAMLAPTNGVKGLGQRGIQRSGIKKELTAIGRRG